MSPWLTAIIGADPQPVSVPFTSNGTFTVPFGVSKVSLSGKGADGSPASTGYRQASTTVDVVQGHATGSGAQAGSLSWEQFQADNTSALSAVNSGGSGSSFGVLYDGYPNSSTYDITLNQPSFSNALPGTASLLLTAGWKTSGVISPTDFGASSITYTQSFPIAATTGASTTGFGKTFPGGVGGAASVTSFNDVTVTENTPYPITVPAGGSLTITYYQ